MLRTILSRSFAPRLFTQRCVATIADINRRLDTIAKKPANDAYHEDVQRVIFTMKDLGLKPTRDSYSLAIAAFHRAGCVYEVEKAYREMQQAGFDSDDATDSVLIATLLRSR